MTTKRQSGGKATQTSRQRARTARLAEQGLKHVKVVVPADQEDEIKQIAAQMRLDKRIERQPERIMKPTITKAMVVLNCWQGSMPDSDDGWANDLCGQAAYRSEYNYLSDYEGSTKDQAGINVTIPEEALETWLETAKDLGAIAEEAWRITPASDLEDSYSDGAQRLYFYSDGAYLIVTDVELCGGDMA